MYILVVLIYTCALFVDVHILVDAHFVNVFCVVGCVLVVDVPICTYLLSRLFKIKAQVDVRMMCTCTLFVDVHNAHFVNVLCVVVCVLVVDVPICTYLLSMLFKIKAHVDIHLMCTCTLFVDVHILVGAHFVNVLCCCVCTGY
jgi:hypothetical protein